MIIDWTHFTPWASLAGGILLGVASAMFVLVNGRILGISRDRVRNLERDGLAGLRRLSDAVEAYVVV